ncbi:MAG: response regulator [Chloroflexi bacterium]|nr:response regulator [Chloroflexota bacterium]
MPRVLVVDDSQVVRRVLTDILTREGMTVSAVANGAEALDAISKDMPDLVLLDIVMPVMDGMEALKLVTEDARFSGLPVLMISSVNDATKVRQAVSLGARDYILKPFDPDTIRAKVRRFLSQRALAASSQHKTEQTSVGTPSALENIRLAKIVLIVDDQRTNVDMAREALEERYELLEAFTGAGAIALAAKERPDLILMDIFMPVMSGVEAAQRIRRLPGLDQTKIVAMVLNVPEEGPLLGHFDGAVPKPLDRNQLLDTVAQFIGLPGLFSFSQHDDVLVLRFHRWKWWTQIDRQEIESLRQQFNRAAARMLETGQLKFLLDLERLDELDEEQAPAAAAIVWQIVDRAKQCRLVVKAALPYRLSRFFESLERDGKVEVVRKFQDGLRAFQNEGGHVRIRSDLRYRQLW